MYVSNTTDISDGYMCFNDSIYTVFTVPEVIYIPCFTKAQYVIYYNEIRPGVKYPESLTVYAKNLLCEVEVYGKSVCINIKFIMFYQIFMLEKRE